MECGIFLVFLNPTLEERELETAFALPQGKSPPPVSLHRRWQEGRGREAFWKLQRIEKFIAPFLINRH